MKKKTRIISVILAASMVLLAGCAQVQLNMDEGAFRVPAIWRSPRTDLSMI